MNNKDGKAISELDHLRQSIADILTTPIGSRVMRRDYGSRLFEKIDRPLNGELIAEIYLDIVESLFIWEPRFELSQVSVQDIKSGQITLDLEGSFLSNGQKIKLENIEITNG